MEQCSVDVVSTTKPRTTKSDQTLAARVACCWNTTGKFPRPPSATCTTSSSDVGKPCKGGLGKLSLILDAVWASFTGRFRAERVRGGRWSGGTDEGQERNESELWSLPSKHERPAEPLSEPASSLKGRTTANPRSQKAVGLPLGLSQRIPHATPKKQLSCKNAPLAWSKVRSS